MKKLSMLALVLVLFSACGSDFPGQPGDVVRVQQNSYGNGNLKEEIPYNKDSRIHGVKRTFYDNGQLESEAKYENGKMEGPYKEYYENGQIRADAVYKDNVQKGTVVV